MSDELDEIEVPKRSNLPLILGVISALLIGGAGGFGAATFAGGDASAEVSEGDEAAVNEEGKAIPDGSARVIHDLGQFTVNLRGAGGGRVLRMTMHLEADHKATLVMKEKNSQLRDSVLMLVSDYTYADLEGVDGKRRLQDELLGRLNSVMTPARAERIYFHDFVVQ
jgi:flagellar basal body-associated protein FliL